MEYQVLTDENKRAMWERTIAQIEEQHYSLTMERQMAAAIVPKAGDAVHPDVAARLKQLNAQITAFEQQHAEAVRQRDAKATTEETLHVVRDAREAVGD